MSFTRSRTQMRAYKSVAGMLVTHAAPGAGWAGAIPLTLSTCCTCHALQRYRRVHDKLIPVSDAL